GMELRVTNYLDDGAVFHLNGARIASVRGRDNPANYGSDAAIQSDEGAAEVLALPTGALVEGDNVLAVEVHQSGSNSSDLVFGLSLTSVISVTNRVTADPMPVVLNEVLVVAETTKSSSSQVTPWIELHNPSTNTVNLGGLSITDDPAEPRKWVFPTSASIGARGFLTVTCDPAQPQSAANTGLRLAFQGGSILLFHRLEAGGGALDTLSYGLQTAGMPVGRVPDGTGDWALAIPTPGGSNV